MHPAELPLEALERQCRFRADRRSGPGGQHRNKVASAAVFTHVPSGISAEANERRSQADNRRLGLFRLRLELALKHRQPVERTEPSERWRQRVRGGKLSVSHQHDDYPALLAELFDYLESTDFDLAAATGYFQVSKSQLVGFLRRHPPALAKLNKVRMDRDLAPLK